jgi:cation diffusion facilitator family transporter
VPAHEHDHADDHEHDHEHDHADDHAVGNARRHGHGGHDHDHEHFGPVDAGMMATREGVRATWISLAALGVTAVLQMAVVGLSGSVALLADTLHNVTDALTAIPLLIAFRLGRRPPTRRYPYGYHRAEDVAGLVIVAMILLSAILAGAEAIRRLAHPEPIEAVGWVLAAGVIGFAGNEAVAWYRTRVGRRIGSAALVADGQHARADGLTSLGVVLSALGALAGIDRADAVVGIAITAAIVITLVRAARAILHRALDGTDEATIALIEAVGASVTGVEHVTDARARWSGHRLLAELCVIVEPTLSVSDGHRIADDVRDALLHDVPRLADATVHVDPHEHASHAGGTAAPA